MLVILPIIKAQIILKIKLIKQVNIIRTIQAIITLRSKKQMEGQVQEQSHS
jgi:hypothetical protein